MVDKRATETSLLFVVLATVSLSGSVASSATDCQISFGSFARFEARRAMSTEVADAFASASGSEAARYEDLSLFTNFIRDNWERIPARDAPSDRMAAAQVKEKIRKYQELGGLVVIDSGGAHSIAIAVVLAEAGYQPVIKIGRNLRVDAEKNLQEVGAMKFYADRMRAAKARLQSDAPIAIIMDSHRRAPILDDPRKNFIDYPLTTIPSKELVKSKYNNTVILVTEGSSSDVIRREDGRLAEILPLLSNYIESGASIYQHRADPYHNGTQGQLIRLQPE